MLVYPTVRCAAAALLARAQRLCCSRLRLWLRQVNGRWCRFPAYAGLGKGPGTAQ
jgi:hypothetical protein